MSNTVLYGRIAKEIEVRYSASGKAVGKFSIAVNRKFESQDGQKVDFFNVTAFGKNAENIEKYFHKGSRIVIYCRPQQEIYTNRDGQKINTVSFVMDGFEFVDSRAEGGLASDQVPAQRPQFAPTYVDTGFMNIPAGLDDDEGLPFN